MLRIDIDTDDKPNIKYRVPRDNPFVNEAGSRPEIWAYGIRNMWRCDFDEGNRKTGTNYFDCTVQVLMRGHPGHNARPRARVPFSSLVMDATTGH